MRGFRCLPVRRVIPGRVSVFRRIQMRRERRALWTHNGQHTSISRRICRNIRRDRERKKTGEQRSEGGRRGVAYASPSGGTGSHLTRRPRAAPCRAASAAVRSAAGLTFHTSGVQNTRCRAGALNCLRERAREREREGRDWLKRVAEEPSSDRVRRAVVSQTLGVKRKAILTGGPASFCHCPGPQTVECTSISGQTEQMRTVRTCTRDEDGRARGRIGSAGSSKSGQQPHDARRGRGTTRGRETHVWVISIGYYCRVEANWRLGIVAFLEPTLYGSFLPDISNVYASIIIRWGDVVPSGLWGSHPGHVGCSGFSPSPWTSCFGMTGSFGLWDQTEPE